MLLDEDALLANVVVDSLDDGLDGLIEWGGDGEDEVELLAMAMAAAALNALIFIKCGEAWLALLRRLTSSLIWDGSPWWLSDEGWTKAKLAACLNLSRVSRSNVGVGKCDDGKGRSCSFLMLRSTAPSSDSPCPVSEPCKGWLTMWLLLSKEAFLDDKSTGSCWTSVAMVLVSLKSSVVAFKNC